MKKNFSLLKQYLLALTLLISATIIIYSCKKDRKFSPLEAKKELISDAKTYFEEEVLSSNLKLYNDPNVRHSIIKRADWKKAVTKKISVGDAVIVPIHFDGNVFSGPPNSNQKSYLNKNSYLMIYKDHGEKMHAEWVTLLPNKLRDARNKKFSGVVVVEDWNGKFNRAFAFNDAGKHIPVYISEAVTFDESSYKRNVTCFDVEHWGAVTVGGISSPKYLGRETFCSNDGSGSGNEDQGHGPNPRTEEEVDPGEYITYFIDCNGDLDGAATIDPNCGCIGGNTGIIACPLKVDVDPKARQCLKDIKSALEALGMKNTSKSTGLIATVLNKLNLSTGTDFKAIITEGKIDIDHLAETTWKTDVDGNRITEIKFTEIHLNKSTDLKMAATMMHEYIHAYFDWNLHLMKNGAITYEANFENTYKLLFDKSGSPLNDGFGTNQHEQIAASFVKEISAMLRNYAINQNIPIPADPMYFEKIGWGGLQYTSLYKYAPEGTTYANSAEAGNNSTTITQILKCKK